LTPKLKQLEVWRRHARACCARHPQRGLGRRPNLSGSPPRFRLVGGRRSRSHWRTRRGRGTRASRRTARGRTTRHSRRITGSGSPRCTGRGSRRVRLRRRGGARGRNSQRVQRRGIDFTIIRQIMRFLITLERGGGFRAPQAVDLASVKPIAMQRGLHPLQQARRDLWRRRRNLRLGTGRAAGRRISARRARAGFSGARPGLAVIIH